MVLESVNDTLLAKQYFPSFVVDFTPPVLITDEYVGPEIVYVIENTKEVHGKDCEYPIPASPDSCANYKWTNTNGVYATGDGFRIDYEITDKNQYVVNGQLKIRIYAFINNDPLSYMTYIEAAESFQDLNVVLPEISQLDSNGQEVIVQPMTEIDNWRYIVENNPYSKIIESANSVSNSISTLFENNVSASVLTAFAANTSSNVVTANTSSSTFFTTANPLYWANAAQYGILHDVTIDISNGHASLFVPSSDVVSLLSIQASYYFGENNKYEAIRTHLVPVANPIGIGLLDPSQVTPVGGDTSYETGVFVSWMQKGPLELGKPALLSPIEDNVVVNFTAGSVNQLRYFGPTPTVSKTSNGRAGGVWMSPHPVINKTCNCDAILAAHASQILGQLSKGDDETGRSSVIPGQLNTTTTTTSLYKYERVPGEESAGSPDAPCCGEFSCDPTSLCYRCWGACYETYISASYLGYTSSARRIFEWMPVASVPGGTASELKNPLWIYVNVTSSNILTPMYADGNSKFSFKVELNDPLNALWIEQAPALDGHNRDRLMGYNQGPDSTPCSIGYGFLSKQTTDSGYVHYVPLSVPGIKIIPSQNLWMIDLTNFELSDLNINIGEDIDAFVRISTSYCDPSILEPVSATNPDLGTTHCMTGLGEVQHPVIQSEDDKGNPNWLEFPPEVMIKEPLSIYLRVESYYEQINKNGTTSYDIVADVKWKGNPITGKFIQNQGLANETIIDYPFPTVNFEAGSVGEGLPLDGRGSSRHAGQDDLGRGVSVKNSSDISLGSYSAVVSLSRTDIYYGNGSLGTSGTIPPFIYDVFYGYNYYVFSQIESHTHTYQVDEFGNGASSLAQEDSGKLSHSHVVRYYTILPATDSWPPDPGNPSPPDPVYHTHGSSHTHSCEVDSNGNGVTNSTIILAGVAYPDHIHTISDYVANATGVIGTIHSHALRSVAIVQMNPLINSFVDLIINGIVVYDPTSCLPYAGSFSVPPYYPLTFPQGNRMMFQSLIIQGSVFRNKTLDVELLVSNVLSSMTVSETSKQNHIDLKASYSPYSLEISPNHWIDMPASPIPDGTRVVFSMSCYNPHPQSIYQPLVVISDAFRDYMLVKVKATVYAEDITTTESKSFLVRSNLNWFPVVDGLVGEPTNDDIYISEVLPQIGTMGASQIHDAVKLASQRLIQYKTDYPQWASAKKAIFLLTDGDENTSQYSLDQAINNVNFIDGNCEVPVIPIRLGYSYSTDEIIMEKYAEETCSKSFNFINATNTDITNVITNIISRDVLGNNNGIYTNTIDLGSDNLASVISIENLLLPIGSKVLFRYRFSADNISWSIWSEWFDSSIVKEFSLDLTYKARYIQYQVHLYGNSNFESPELYAGITLDYFKKETFTTFFQPIDLDINTDEYLASIHISHKATVPATSIINYGYSQSDTTDIADYSSVTRPLIVPERHTILLSRYNEMLITQNYISYFAINGSWVDGALIQIYKISNGLSQLVDASKYTVNSKKGLVTFSNLQNKADTFVICITLDPAFRITCNVVNYGPNPVVVDHIGILYNTTKRIPVDKNGNIINTPISKRIL